MVRKVITLLIVAPATIVLLVLTVANRHTVMVSFDPVSPQAPVYGIEMPVFLLVFISLLAGVAIGGAATWFRQGEWRRAARKHRSEAERAERESERLRRAVSEPAGPALPQPGKPA